MELYSTAQLQGCVYFLEFTFFIQWEPSQNQTNHSVGQKCFMQYL